MCMKRARSVGKYMYSTTSTSHRYVHTRLNKLENFNSFSFYRSPNHHSSKLCFTAGIRPNWMNSLSLREMLLAMDDQITLKHQEILSPIQKSMTMLLMFH